MIHPKHTRLNWHLAGLAFLGVLICGFAIPPDNQGSEFADIVDPYCIASARQIVYTAENPNTIITYKPTVISGKSAYVYSVDVNGDSLQNIFSTKDISMVLDQEATIPGFIVFNKRGKPYCSVDMGLLDFPDYFSYRCLTKDRKVITAGILKSRPIDPLSSVRKLVNDNINNEDIPVILKDNIVIECYKTSNWIGATYTINVNVTPTELEYYKDDIISMLKEGYEKMDNATQLVADTSEDENSDETDSVAVTEPQAETAPDHNTIAVPVVAIEGQNETGQTHNTEPVETEKVEATTENELPETTKIQDSPDDQPKNLGARKMPPKLEDAISVEDREAIQKEAEDKLYRLQDCFVMLVNRNYSSQQKQRERETTIQDLFINDRANVGVSSVNSDVINNYLIGDYLIRLEQMITGAYQKVEIVFSEIYKVSNFKPNPDGTWSATVTFSQQFKGFKDVDGKQLVYSDITQKNVTVRIRRVELFTGNSTPDVYWEVLLADIGVNQTQAF